MKQFSRRTFIRSLSKFVAIGKTMPRLIMTSIIDTSSSNSRGEQQSSSEAIEHLLNGWKEPPTTYRPHTRWWWPGNAVTTEGIDWELQQMSQQGVGGVEIMSPWLVYTKGNIDYLSSRFLELTQYAIRSAKRNNMEVSLSFGAGWCFGGFWVETTHRSKVLTHSYRDIEGPSVADISLPEYSYPPQTSEPYGKLDPHFHSEAVDENLLIAVVAGKLAGKGLEASSLVDLTKHVQGGSLHWKVPEGKWKIMAFRLKYTGEQNAATDNFSQKQWVADHFSKEAMTAYCDFLGTRFYDAFGSEFGKTLETLFSDSFEVNVIPGTIHWSNNALSRFQAIMGYDLTRYLPAIWWDIGNLTPKIRYDVNEFLGRLGIEATFNTFTEWCTRHGIQAKMQPHYRFTEELIQGAGLAHRPEMEVTTARFAVVTDPRKSIAAGGHFYDRKIISAEAYTFIHGERYRTTLADLKIATDAFLRDGATQLYNHGYLYSPEMHVAPSRDVPWANRISHWNTWWPQYHHLASYVARCCFLLRQGEFVGDILIYSPQSSVWTEKVLFNNERRVMPFGDIGQTLVANGYDFDPINDDVLQKKAVFADRHVLVGNLSYRVLILPRITAIPLATLEQIQRFVDSGGVVIALHELPSASVGMKDHEASDLKVHALIDELFGADRKGHIHPSGGTTCFLGNYKVPDYEATVRTFNPFGDQDSPAASRPTKPQTDLIRVLRHYLLPDFGLEGEELSTGLTFIHRKIRDVDVYFVTNLQNQPTNKLATFRVPGTVPEIWDPATGQIQRVFIFTPHSAGVDVPIQLSAFASRFFVFRPGTIRDRVIKSNLVEISRLDRLEITGIAERSGPLEIEVLQDNHLKIARSHVAQIPDTFLLDAEWSMTLEGYQFTKLERRISRLLSWSEDEELKSFSGTGRYLVSFPLPDVFLEPDLQITLDLGLVGDIAEITLNNQTVGTTWMAPHAIDISQRLRQGVNQLEIRVTNTLINSVAGMAKVPEVPFDLESHYGKTNSTYKQGEAVWKRREQNFRPLPVSGLIGPVRLIPRRRVRIALQTYPDAG